MIIAIVTSREAEPGKSKWLTNNDLAKSFFWTISQTIRNMAMKKIKDTWYSINILPEKYNILQKTNLSRHENTQILRSVN